MNSNRLIILISLIILSLLTILAFIDEYLFLFVAFIIAAIGSLVVLIILGFIIYDSFKHVDK